MSKRIGPAPQRTRPPGPEAYSTVIAFCPEAFVEVDDTGTVTEWNPHAEITFGWRRDEVVGQRADETIFSGGLSEVVPWLQGGATENGSAAQPRVVPLLTGSGLRVTTEALVFGLGPGKERAPSRWGAFLRHLDAVDGVAPTPVMPRPPTSDPLTGLRTREGFVAHVARVLERETRPGSVAVGLLDVDRFKDINRAWGQNAGDAVLVQVAARLRRLIESDAGLCRLGDGFLVLFVDSDGGAQQKAAAFVERAHGALAAPFETPGGDVFVEVSAGLALNTFGVSDADTLVANAESAMYEAKERGGTGIELFAEAIRVRAADRMATEHALHRALERQELVLHFQPVVELEGMVPTGAEALLRWRHPDQGLLAPSRFIPVAEDSGLILPIGAWVIESACTQLRSWEERHRALTDRSVDVNLSARQVDDPRLVRTVEDVLSRTGLPPRSLTLEITESALVRDASAARAVMRALKDLGVQLAIDDFGTGYSSLSHLQHFPIDVLKVDQTFVSRLDRSKDAERIVAAVVDLAHALGMQVVAEGVETVAQLQMLRALGCDLAQGHLFSPAVPADELGPQLALPMSA